MKISIVDNGYVYSQKYDDDAILCKVEVKTVCD